MKEQAQTKLWEMEDTWWDRKAEKVQMYADAHNSKKFYNALKEIYGPSKSRSTPLQSADGSDQRPGKPKEHMGGALQYTAEQTINS